MEMYEVFPVELNTLASRSGFKSFQNTSRLPLDQTDVQELDLGTPGLVYQSGDTLAVIAVAASTQDRPYTKRLRFVRAEGDQVIADRTERTVNNWPGLCEAAQAVGVEGVPAMRARLDKDAEERRLDEEAARARDAGDYQAWLERQFTLYERGEINARVFKPGDMAQYRDWKARKDGEAEQEGKPRRKRQRRLYE